MLVLMEQYLVKYSSCMTVSYVISFELKKYIYIIQSSLSHHTKGVIWIELYKAFSEISHLGAE